MGEIGNYWNEAREDSKHAERRRRCKGDLRGDPDHCDDCGGFHGIGMLGQICSACTKKGQDGEDDDSIAADFRFLKEKRREQKRWHQENTAPSDKALLKEYGLPFSVESDGSGGERYLIEIRSDYGPKIIEWWVSTGLWKVRGSNAKGYGLYKMVRYFKLQEKNR